MHTQPGQTLCGQYSSSKKPEKKQTWRTDAREANRQHHTAIARSEETQVEDGPHEGPRSSSEETQGGGRTPRPPSSKKKHRWRTDAREGPTHPHHNPRPYYATILVLRGHSRDGGWVEVVRGPSRASVLDDWRVTVFDDWRASVFDDWRASVLDDWRGRPR